MFNDNTQSTNSQFILYQDDNGVTNVNVRLGVWMLGSHPANLINKTTGEINLHKVHKFSFCCKP